MPESNEAIKEAQKPGAQTALVGLTKRQQLKKTNQVIFMWVAAAAVVLAFSIVALQFLVRQGLFNGKIISEQQKTERALEDSKKNFDGLKRNVDALLADTDLAILRANPSDNTLQVILDALPTTGDPTTFANSLYSKVLPKSGVSITDVSVTTAAAGAATAVPAATTPVVAAAGGGTQPLPFDVSIAGAPEQVKNTLMDMEKVIRPMVVRQLNVTVNGSQLNTNIVGETYYLPRTKVELGDKVIKP